MKTIHEIITNDEISKQESLQIQAKIKYEMKVSKMVQAENC